MHLQVVDACALDYGENSETLYTVKPVIVPQEWTKFVFRGKALADVHKLYTDEASTAI